MDFTPLAENPRSLRFYLGLLQAPFFILAIGLPLLAANIFQFAGLFLILPYSKHAYRTYNHGIAHIWWSLLVMWIRKVQRVRIVRTGDAIPLRQSAIVFCNHVEQPDIPVALTLAADAKSLGGVKFFVKAPLRWVPGIGWGMQMLNFLFVKRAWSADARFVDRMFQRIVEYRTPVWVLSYPEGTRIKPHKLKRSQEFAKKNHYPFLENLLLPKARGFVTTVERLRHRVDGVYDLTIAYPNGIPTLMQLVRGQVSEVHLDVRRFPMRTLPSDAEGLTRWLSDRFIEKDRRLTAFFRDRRFAN